MFRSQLVHYSTICWAGHQARLDSVALPGPHDSRFQAIDADPVLSPCRYCCISPRVLKYWNAGFGEDEISVDDSRFPAIGATFGFGLRYLWSGHDRLSFAWPKWNFQNRQCHSFRRNVSFQSGKLLRDRAPQSQMNHGDSRGGESHTRTRNTMLE
jgi:hypothetical protein